MSPLIPALARAGNRRHVETDRRVDGDAWQSAREIRDHWSPEVRFVRLLNAQIRQQNLFKRLGLSS